MTINGCGLLLKLDIFSVMVKGRLDEDGELIVSELGGWNCKKCLKGGGMAERVGKQKRKGYMLVKVVSALEKWGAMTPLRTLLSIMITLEKRSM